MIGIANSHDRRIMRLVVTQCTRDKVHHVIDSTSRDIARTARSNVIRYVSLRNRKENVLDELNEL